ncbi:MAG: flavodoxin family protein [Candidatus Zixiibacteriota bacterium]
MSNENIQNNKGFILGIMASGRRFSNSGRLLEEALQATENMGYRSETIFLADYSINPCTGCKSCEHTGSCVIRDDMDTLYTLVDRADGIIFATPVYFYSVPGHAKMFIDRFQPYWARRYKLGQKPEHKRLGATIAIAGTSGKKVFECIRLPVKYFYDSIFMDDYEPLVFPDFDEDPKKIKNTMFKKAFEYGKKYATLFENLIQASE